MPTWRRLRTAVCWLFFVANVRGSQMKMVRSELKRQRSETVCLTEYSIKQAQSVPSKRKQQGARLTSIESSARTSHSLQRMALLFPATEEAEKSLNPSPDDLETGFFLSRPDGR